MEKELKIFTIKEICEGFVFDKKEEKGLFGLNGKLIVQPEYQRNYIYDKGGKDVAVIESVLRGYPIGLFYFVQINKEKEENRNKTYDYEVLDGQQRITSIGRFVSQTYRFAVKDENGEEQYFDSLSQEEQERILNTEIVTYVCSGTSTEIQQWFKKINIAGVPLKDQELRNASYYGSFVTLAKKEFSNTSNSNMKKWLTYINGDPKRQEVLEEALKWVSNHNIEKYMADHRNNNDISELQEYFDKVIEWVSGLFNYTGPEMKGRPWGDYYRNYHENSYDKIKFNERLLELLKDPYINKRTGIPEYLLGNEKHPELLDIRVFDKKTREIVYQQQTQYANAKGISNCPLCAQGIDENSKRIWKIDEMDADHVYAWSKGGTTDINNCQMLCITHNRSKGNT